MNQTTFCEKIFVKKIYKEFNGGPRYKKKSYCQLVSMGSSPSNATHTILYITLPVSYHTCMAEMTIMLEIIS